MQVFFYYALTIGLAIIRLAINDVVPLPSSLNPLHFAFLLCPFSALTEIPLWTYKSFKRQLGSDLTFRLVTGAWGRNPCNVAC